MSTLPYGPGAPEPSPQPRPVLRVVPPHEHTWQLRGIEYDDTFSVTRFECECGEVRFD